jgi:trehalose synthase-fused probable maltokinase
VKSIANSLHIRWYGRWETLLERGLPQRWAKLLGCWMSRQRWYLGKEDRPPILHLEQSWPIEIAGRTVWWCIIKAYSQGMTRQYQLPMVLLKERDLGQIIASLGGAEDGFVVDAWSWPSFAQWILRLMAGEEHAEHLAAWHQAGLRTDVDAKPLLKDQSNTAVTLGETYFLKAMRSLAHGIQPEEEMGRELTRRSFPYTIPMLAGLSFSSQTEPTSMAVLSKFVPCLGNGWEWLLASLDELVRIPAIERWDHIPSNCAFLIDCAQLLGQRTAELHRCLAQPSDDPAFTPEPFEQQDYDALCSRIIERYEILWNLTKHHNGSPLRELFKRKDTLRAITQQPFIPTTLQRHRIHGDYHLGQVLRTENDWLIIDFEGEPLRPLNERRAKDSGLRDVAGMMRSFGYLAGVIESPFPGELRQAFIEGYKKAEPTLPSASANQLLLLYLLEKALYEIEYELSAQRGPDWLLIPLSYVVSVLEQWNKK